MNINKLIKNDYAVYGYEYYGYGIEERKKMQETDRLLRKFILNRKKSDRKTKTYKLFGFLSEKSTIFGKF